MSHPAARRFWQYALLAAMLLVLTIGLLYPIYLTVRGGLAEDPATGEGLTLEHVSLVFQDPLQVRSLIGALKIAVLTTLMAILIALPLAMLAARRRFPGKAFFSAAILSPLVLPPFVGAIGFRMLLGRQGAVNAILGTQIDFFGGNIGVFGDPSWLIHIDLRLLLIALVEALHLYPIIYLNATASLANLDPALDESAENLGAGSWRRFIRITLPLIRPGLFAGGTIVFIWSFTELGTPLMFDYKQVTPVQIFEKLKEVEGSAEPYALTLVLLGSAVIAYVLGKTVFGRRGYAMYSKASRAAGEVRLTGVVGWLATGAFTLVTLLALLPHIGVILTSVAAPGSWYQSALPAEFTSSHYVEALTSDLAFTSIKNSLILSVLAMALSMLMGVVVAYLIVRTTLKGRGLLDTLCMMPLAVPGLVMAFGYVALTLNWPFEGSLSLLGLSIPAFLDGTWLDLDVLGVAPNPFPLLILAYTIRRLPYIVRSTVAGLEQTSGELEEAAVNLGAGRIAAIRKVIVPLIMANLIAGGLLVFSFSMLEVSDSLILAQRADHFPITKAIFEFMNRLGDGPYIASAMGVWGMALLMLTLFGASMMLGKRLGSIFRV